MEAEVAAGYCCGRCRRHWDTFLRAESCCAAACADCGVAFGAQAVRYSGDDGQGRCWVCWRSYQERCEAKRYEQAISCPAIGYAGPVYYQNREKFYPSALEAFAAVQDEVLGGEIERVQVRCYVCTIKPFRLTTAAVLARALEEHAPGSAFDEEARLVMSRFLELWNARYADQVESWIPDFSRKIVFPDIWVGSPSVVEVEGEEDLC